MYKTAIRNALRYQERTGKDISKTGPANPVEKPKKAKQAPKRKSHALTKRRGTAAPSNRGPNKKAKADLHIIQSTADLRATAMAIALSDAQSKQDAKGNKTIRVELKTRPSQIAQVETRSVWCTRCESNMLASRTVIIRHFTTDHNRQPTEKEITAVLRNVQRQLPTVVVRNGTSGSGFDKNDEHERRWRHIIQAGAPSLGKRK